MISIILIPAFLTGAFILDSVIGALITGFITRVSRVGAFTSGLDNRLLIANGVINPMAHERATLQGVACARPNILPNRGSASAR